VAESHASDGPESLVGSALLGIVIEHPGYPFELAKRYERTRHGAPSPSRRSLSSLIEAALAMLASRSLIKEIPGRPVGQPTRY